MRVKNIKLSPIKIDLENGSLHHLAALINDFYEKEIASNKQVYQLHIIPENSENLELLLFRLKSILKLSENNVSKKQKLKPKNPGIQ